ncbi:TetR/AcrR family transcriptional regulator [Herminiimonas sp. NPDC097707]|uniref:TetR/AcrR family transcriptional regulator n=1 Tax=Herminiimonas sp. NPDC097707 TaxID=3364007 RepID=UPI00383A0DA3
MPRVSRDQADLNRAAIENVSAKLFREKGFNGVSVSDLMAAAGLTHGGFYGHFSSKDELAAFACASAFNHAVERWEKRIENTKDEKTAFKTIVDNYLSSKNVLDIGNSCPGPALAVDVAREPLDKPVHAAYLTGTKELVEVLASLCPSVDPATRRKVALAQWSTMVGAMMLARATHDDTIAEEILSAARTQLLADADI